MQLFKMNIFNSSKTQLGIVRNVYYEIAPVFTLSTTIQKYIDLFMHNNIYFFINKIKVYSVVNTTCAWEGLIYKEC